LESSVKLSLTDMPDRLPSLTALRAFEAAARHMSFARAASELNVTPAALSFQIKSLEDHLGHPVFRRLNRAVELTEAGQTLAPGTSQAFDALARAWQNTQRLNDHTTLTVTAGPAFTAKWLAPRLYEFARAHPEIDLRFSASLRIVDFARDDVDIAIRFGYDRDEAGLFCHQLAHEWATPVMTPELAAQYPTPQSLTKAPLLFDDAIEFLSPPLDWPTWFRSQGVDFTPQHGAHFSQSDHAVDAALAGVGVVMGRRAIVIKELNEGHLVAPFKTALSTKANFRFLCRAGTETRPNINAFRKWIMKEIEKTAHVSDQFTIIPVEKVADR
jgi:LysR family glycine cleavage system transcriptional activator